MEIRKKSEEELRSQVEESGVQFDPEDLSLSKEQLIEKYKKPFERGEIGEDKMKEYILFLREKRRSFINTTPTPFDKLITGIDKTKLLSEERIKKIQSQAMKDQYGASDIGMALGDTSFFSNFIRLLKYKPRVINGILSKPNNFQEAVEPIANRFKNQVIVEIGPGQSPGQGYQLASLCGAKSYVGVDPFFSDDLASQISRQPSVVIREKSEEEEEDDRKKGIHGGMHVHRRKHGEKESANTLEYEDWGVPGKFIVENNLFENKIPWDALAQDGLSFLRSLPDNSVSVIMGGLSEWVISSEIMEEMAKEIERVLDPKGAFLNIGSWCFPKLKEEVSFEGVLSSKYGLWVKPE